MIFLIAINSFKGTISSLDVGKIVYKELKKKFKKANFILSPVSDGGDGFIDCFKNKKAKIIKKKVTGPIYKKVLARYVLEGKNAYIEIAQACGIRYLKKEELSPLKATSYGVGELILDAIKKGATHLYLGLGGTASSDGGYGMAKALGFVFLDENDREIKDSVSEFSKIKKIIPPKKNLTKNVKIFAVTDVKNPLLGKNGSAYVFGPQKGASQKEVEIIEKNLKSLALKIKELNGKDITKIEGGGAAGGLGAGLYGFLNAKILQGAFFISEKLNLLDKIKKSDIIITGEGKFDKTSFMGKITGLIYDLARQYKKKIILISAKNQLEIDDENVLNITLEKHFPEKYCKEKVAYAISKAIEINEKKIKEFAYKNSKIF